MKFKNRQDSQNLSKINKSSVNLRKAHLNEMPREILSKIILYLTPEEKFNLQSTCINMYATVNDEIRRRFIVWTLKQNVQPLSFVGSVKLSVGLYVDNRLTPAILDELINVANGIEINAERALIEEKDILLMKFYKIIDVQVNEFQRKALFTATMLKLLLALDESHITVKHASDGNATEINFSINDVFFGILWSKRSINTFSFSEDWHSLLIMLTKFVDMKLCSARNENVALSNCLYPMSFEKKLIGLGFQRIPKRNGLSRVKVLLKGSKEMMKKINNLIFTREPFLCDLHDETFQGSLLFICNQARNCGCCSKYFLSV